MERTLLEALPYLFGAALLAVLAGFLLFRGILRYWQTTFAVEIHRHARWPWRMTISALGALTTIGSLRLADDVRTVVRHVLLLAIVTGLTWLLTAALRAVELAAIDRNDVSVADNRRARSRRTRYVVLRRVGTAITILLGIAAALLTFPSARAVGASLLASAGVLGIVIGVGAQQSLKNLMAGIQIAFAEPIRLGDAVVVDGEWGTIEDITLTTVVVQVWDKRRLIYPTSWFTEHSFQNGTRRDAQLLGQVTLDLDFRADVERLREAATRIIESSEHFDGEAHAVQVIDATDTGIVVRLLMSAVDAPTAWDLRVHVRERVVAWLAEHNPKGLPVIRLRDADSGHDVLTSDEVGHAPTPAAPAGPTPTVTTDRDEEAA